MTPTEIEVRRLLGEVYTPDGVETWLRSRNTSFRGRSAREMLDAGHSEVVLARAQFIAGWAR